MRKKEAETAAAQATAVSAAATAGTAPAAGMAPQAAAQPPHLPPHEHVAELTATLQRLQADFDNYKKYIEKERQRWQQDALRGFVRELLPVLDAFEIALKTTGGNEAGANRGAGANAHQAVAEKEKLEIGR